MIKKEPFTEQLLAELVRWVELGLITSLQKGKIENLYLIGTDETEKTKPAQSEVSKSRDNINIPKVIIGLATLCIAVGIVIFYASNWRKMSPSLKLVQVFFLIVATYGSAWWFLQTERKFSLIGEALLLLGMASYGAGIMLVAQVYHISSHPTNGVLAWAIGAFAMSVIMRSKYGLYLSMLLMIIWDLWEYTYFGNPGYFFGLPVVLSAVIFFREKNTRGLAASSLIFSCYFLQISFYWIEHYSTGIKGASVLIALFIAIGAAMRYAANRINMNPDLKKSGTIIFLTGWAAWALPLFQISALQPNISNPLVVWGTTALFISIITRERNGYYFSSAIFFIWSLSTETTAYGYIVPVIILSVLFYYIRDRIGMAISAISFLYYYFMATTGLIPSDAGFDARLFIIIILQFPFAATLITFGKIVSDDNTLKSGGKIFTIAGWFSLLVPFIAISWPLQIESLPYIAVFGRFKHQSIEYILLTMFSLAGVYVLHKKKENLRLLLPPLILSVAMFFLPLNHTSTRMITLHLAALLFIYILLYYSHIYYEKNSFERTFSFIFAIWLIAVKGIGFITYSAIEESFKLAYLTGFILFAIVCFLINRFIHETLSAEGTDYRGGIIDAVCAGGIWITVYLASFRVESQNSIFTADSLVIKMTVLFLAIAVALYYILYKKIHHGRIVLNLSLVIFLSSGITLLVSGPWIPWEMYAVIFNILLFITSAVIMYYSSIMQSKKILNFATAGILLQVFTRYFDLFWDMFSGALLFIITGILGLAGGYILEKKRKDLTEIIETTSASKENREGIGR